MLLMSMSVSTYSQFLTKGSIIANGSFSFYSTKFKESKDKYSGFEIVPWGGYLVADNLAIGAMIEFEQDVVKNDDIDYKETGTGFLFGPVVRYYLNNGFFAHGDLGIGKKKSETESGSSSFESEYDLTQFRIGIGYAIRITDTVFFDPIIGFKSSKEKYDVGDDTETGIFGMGSFTIKIK